VFRYCFSGIQSVGELFAGAVSGENEAVDGNGGSGTGSLWIIFRDVYRMPGTGYRGDAGQYSYFCKKDFVPAWSGMGDLRYGCGEIMRIPAVFCNRILQDGAISMKQQLVYLKCDRNAEVQAQDVFLKDVAEVRCRDKVLSAKLNAIKVCHFPKEGEKRCVISCLKLVRLMEELCPEIDVQVVGVTDVLVEWISVDRYKGWRQWSKAAFVCLISFFGTAFTIMAYHNDVGINEVFTGVYRMCMGAEPGGMNTLEVAYSVGLAAGIIVFFNHIGGRRLMKDPTPVEVSIKNYETDVDKTLIEQAGREDREIEGDS
jgi:stage V sporulation protein AA